MFLQPLHHSSLCPLNYPSRGQQMSVHAFGGGRCKGKVTHPVRNPQEKSVLDGKRCLQQLTLGHSLPPHRADLGFSTVPASCLRMGFKDCGIRSPGVLGVLYLALGICMEVTQDSPSPAAARNWKLPRAAALIKGQRSRRCPGLCQRSAWRRAASLLVRAAAGAKPGEAESWLEGRIRCC